MLFRFVCRNDPPTCKADPQLLWNKKNLNPKRNQVFDAPPEAEPTDQGSGDRTPTRKKRGLFGSGLAANCRRLHEYTTILSNLHEMRKALFKLKICQRHHFSIANGVEHGDDVPGRNVGHDVVHLLKYESTSRGEHLHLSPDVLADAFGCTA